MGSNNFINTNNPFNIINLICTPLNGLKYFNSILVISFIKYSYLIQTTHMVLND